MGIIYIKEEYFLKQKQNFLRCEKALINKKHPLDTNAGKQLSLAATDV